MDDLISRQALLESIERISVKGNVLDDDWVYRFIQEFPSAHQWIPCSERLPEKGNEVLVCYDYKGHRSVFTGTLYDDGKFYGYDDEYLTPEGRKYRKAVAWMPLPKPYEERKEE